MRIAVIFSTVRPHADAAERHITGNNYRNVLARFLALWSCIKTRIHINNHRITAQLREFILPNLYYLSHLWYLYIQGVHFMNHTAPLQFDCDVVRIYIYQHCRPTHPTCPLMGQIFVGVLISVLWLR